MKLMLLGLRDCDAVGCIVHGVQRNSKVSASQLNPVDAVFRMAADMSDVDFDQAAERLETAKKKAEEEAVIAAAAAAAAKNKTQEADEETEDEENEEEEEELECDEYEYEGEIYGLAPNGDIYSQDGDLVGKLTNGVPNMFN